MDYMRCGDTLCDNDCAPGTLEGLTTPESARGSDGILLEPCHVRATGNTGRIVDLRRYIPRAHLGRGPPSLWR